MGDLVLPRAAAPATGSRLGGSRRAREPGRRALPTAPAANAAFADVPRRGRVVTQLQGLGSDALEDHVYRTAVAQHVPLPGPQDDLRARRHGERVPRAPRAGLAGEARRGRRRAAQEVRVEARPRSRTGSAARNRRSSSEKSQASQPDDGHPRCRWAAACSARCSAGAAAARCGKASSAARSIGRVEQGAHRRCGCRGGRGPRCTSSRTHSKAELEAEITEPRIRVRPRDDPDRDGRESRPKQDRHRRRRSGARLVAHDVESGLGRSGSGAMDDHWSSKIIKRSRRHEEAGRGRPRRAAARRPAELGTARLRAVRRRRARAPTSCCKNAPPPSALSSLAGGTRLAVRRPQQPRVAGRVSPPRSPSSASTSTPRANSGRS